MEYLTSVKINKLYVKMCLNLLKIWSVGFRFSCTLNILIVSCQFCTRKSPMLNPARHLQKVELPFLFSLFNQIENVIEFL